jgi:hypothetical protein
MSTSLPTTLTLAEALALPAGAELDALVAERVMGWTDSRKLEDWWWKPSTDIRQAWEVLNHVASTRDVKVSLERCYDARSWNCTIEDDVGHVFGCDLVDAPLAICRAALKACWEPKSNPAETHG